MWAFRTLRLSIALMERRAVSDVYMEGIGRGRGGGLAAGPGASGTTAARGLQPGYIGVARETSVHGTGCRPRWARSRRKGRQSRYPRSVFHLASAWWSAWERNSERGEGMWLFLLCARTPAKVGAVHWHAGTGQSFAAEPCGNCTREDIQKWLGGTRREEVG